MLDTVVDYFLAKPGIEALYLQGSVAADSADEYSDIDLRVVVQPDAYLQYLSERFAAPMQWGEWLYNEWANRAWVCVSHFKPFNKIDVLYFQPHELQPSPWFLLPTQVIYDPKSLLREVMQASLGLTFTWNIQEVDRLISKGLAYAEEGYRRIMREELFYAQSLLDSFRAILMQFDDMCRQSPSAASPAAHFEQQGSQACIQSLNHSYTSLDKHLLLQALSELLQFYYNQVAQIHNTLALQRDMQTDLFWIYTILELCKEHIEV
ncbi:nucleotidyltransferase domain-containing protein [Acaryochloris sp. IP29b_bin.148]|uniref:nucleotidyltransferase family protein n=1 Tax=Acaryochloris sp. IP29b_bin.148 TaxID=2969218 RepID=UPI0026237F5C|nr:nucleotidyltransferase domain-containing protein [Acaryochloris sp. IP29b_bin.148]